MWLMYGGFLTAFAVPLAVFAVWTLPTHSNPAAGVLAFAVLIPGFLIAFSGEFLAVTSKDEKALVTEALTHGIVTRRFIFLVGLATGVGSIAVMAAIYGIGTAFVLSRTGLMISVGVMLLPLPLAPPIGFAWLLTKCKSRTPPTQ